MFKFFPYKKILSLSLILLQLLFSEAIGFFAYCLLYSFVGNLTTSYNSTFISAESFTFDCMRSANISILDFVLLPFVLAVVYAIAYKFRDSRYSRKHPWRKYFIPALTVKIFGAVFIGLIYAYYYGGGDTFNYFEQAKVINSSFDESFLKWFNLLFHLPSQYDNNYYTYISKLFWYRDPASYTVCSITAFFGIFTYNTYLPTAVLFALYFLYGYMGIVPHFCFTVSSSYATYCHCHFIYTQCICLGVGNL